MIAYDTDVPVELLKGHATYAAKARAIPNEEQFVPIVVVEEIQRGCLNSIRQAAGPTRSARAAGYFPVLEMVVRKTKLDKWPVARSDKPLRQGYVEISPRSRTTR